MEGGVQKLSRGPLAPLDRRLQISVLEQRILILNHLHLLIVADKLCHRKVRSLHAYSTSSMLN
jgi:hypothetical protein